MSTPTIDEQPPATITDADWATAIETGTFPTVDTLAEPTPAPETNESDTGRRIQASYLLTAMHWLPMDYSATDLPGLGALTREHQQRTRSIPNKGLRTAHIGYAFLASASGTVLNAVSWSLAALSTGLNRGLVSGEAWQSEQGKVLRPRSLLVLARDNADRADRIGNTAARSFFILVAAAARVAAQSLNAGSYGLARLAVTLNSPERLGTAAIPTIAALAAWVLWTVTGGA